MASDVLAGMAEPEIPAAVVGGIEWQPDANYLSIHTVRELSRTRPVLHIYPVAAGGLKGRLRALARDPARLVRTASALEVHQETDTLWLAPLEGPSTLAPLASPELVRRYNVRLCAKAIREWLDILGADRCLLVCYWWFVHELVQKVPCVASIYDCADEHAHYPGSSVKEDTVRRLEGRLLDAVDASFVVSPGLLPPREAPGRRLTVLPASFDGRTFAEVMRNRPEVPEPLRSVEGPVVGHTGALGGRADVPLMEELVRRRPEWTFAFVGADAPSALPGLVGRPNVLMLGPLPYADAMGALARFDVGIIPFITTPFTLGNSPMKLLDHLAHGTPVVAPPLPDMVGAAEGGENLVRLAAGADAWEGAIADALAEPPDAPAREARRRYTERRDVQNRVRRMLQDVVNPPNDSQTTSPTGRR
jgi:glycosyltransferase involved in cell wall biosynthesis